eukprot:154786-Prorocentrum_minimum.AAC.6
MASCPRRALVSSGRQAQLRDHRLRAHTPSGPPLHPLWTPFTPLWAERAEECAIGRTIGRLWNDLMLNVRWLILPQAQAREHLRRRASTCACAGARALAPVPGEAGGGGEGGGGALAGGAPRGTAQAPPEGAPAAAARRAVDAHFA